MCRRRVDQPPGLGCPLTSNPALGPQWASVDHNQWPVGTGQSHGGHVAPGGPHEDLGGPQPWLRPSSLHRKTGLASLCQAPQEGAGQQPEACRDGSSVLPPARALLLPPGAAPALPRACPLACNQKEAGRVGAPGRQERAAGKQRRPEGLQVKAEASGPGGQHARLLSVTVVWTLSPRPTVQGPPQGAGIRRRALGR